MAPPSSRRTGFSKKAQYSRFTGYLLAGAGAVLGLALLVISLWNPPAFAPLRGVAGDAVMPVASASAAVRAESHGFFASIAGYFNAGSQNAELRRENELARIRLVEAEAIKAENRSLKGLLALRDDESKPLAVARLVGSTATSGRRHAYISVGTARGIKPGMPVISDRGVIGRVLEAGRSSARVLLLTDSESVLPVRRATDNVIAFAEGRGDGLLRIRLVNLGVNPLKVGDMMVTSGAGGYYRPGVAVAVIAQITNDGGIARLVAEPAATNYVSVMPVHEAEAVAELEAPEVHALAPAAKPAPAAAASFASATAPEE